MILKKIAPQGLICPHPRAICIHVCYMTEENPVSGLAHSVLINPYIFLKLDQTDENQIKPAPGG